MFKCKPPGGKRGTEWKAAISPGEGIWEACLDVVAEGQTIAGRREWSEVVWEGKKLSTGAIAKSLGREPSLGMGRRVLKFTLRRTDDERAYIHFAIQGNFLHTPLRTHLPFPQVFPFQVLSSPCTILVQVKKVSSLWQTHPCSYKVWPADGAFVGIGKAMANDWILNFFGAFRRAFSCKTALSTPPTSQEPQLMDSLDTSTSFMNL